MQIVVADDEQQGLAHGDGITNAFVDAGVDVVRYLQGRARSLVSFEDGRIGR